MELKEISLVTADYGGGNVSKTFGLAGVPASTFRLSSGKYPLVIYYHGLGGGRDIGSLRNQALPAIVAKYGIWGQFGGKQVDFAMIAIADYWWSMDPKLTSRVLAFMEQYYPGKIDFNHVIATGLSAGGANTVSAITDPDIAKYYSAAIPLSVQALPWDVKKWQPVKDNRIETLFGTGNSDPGYMENTRAGNRFANQVFEGSSKLIEWPGGHGNWENVYDSAHTFAELNNQNVWTWAIADAIPVTPEPEPTPPPAQKKPRVIIYDDFSIEKVA